MIQVQIIHPQATEDQTPTQMPEKGDDGDWMTGEDGYSGVDDTNHDPYIYDGDIGALPLDIITNPN